MQRLNINILKIDSLFFFQISKLSNLLQNILDLLRVKYELMNEFNKDSVNIYCVLCVNYYLIILKFS